MFRLAFLGAAVGAILVLASRPAAAAASGAAARPDSADAVRHVIAGISDAWNASDMPAFGALFAPDADYVVITGRRLVGRDEVERYHAELLGHLYRGSRLEITAVDVRFLTPEVALAQVASQVTFHDGQDTRQGAALMVLGRREGRWRVASVHNALAGGIPVRPPGTP